MAVIPYTKVELSNKRFLIVWDGLAGLDSGQPFDASNAMFQSAHLYRSGTIEVIVKASNEILLPANGFRIPTVFDSTSGGVAFNMNSQPYRWFYIDPVPFFMPGLLTVSILFKEE